MNFLNVLNSSWDYCSYIWRKRYIIFHVSHNINIALPLLYLLKIRILVPWLYKFWKQEKLYRTVFSNRKCNFTNNFYSNLNFMDTFISQIWIINGVWFVNIKFVIDKNVKFSVTQFQKCTKFCVSKVKRTIFSKWH